MDPVQQAIQEAAGNVQLKSFIFPFQSFFDTTQLGQALTVQPTNESIIPSTLTPVASPGFGVGLHPDSQCPVAVRFKSNAGVGDSQVTVLTPGQIVTPHGCAPFSGFDVGLPFGWLGGGSAQIAIMKTPAAAMWWAAGAEVVIQRQRVLIQADGATPTFSLGLPVGFPWKNALRYNAGAPGTPFSQGGQAVISAIPTRTELKLRLNVLASDALVLVLVKNTQAFDTSQTGTLSGEYEVVPVLFPKIIGAPNAQFPTAGFSSPVPGGALSPVAPLGYGNHSPGVYLAGDDATFCVVNESGNAALNGAYVDIVRYGLI